MLEHFARRGNQTPRGGKNHTFSDEALAKLDYADIRDREPFRAYNGFVTPHWHSVVYWPAEDCYPHINTESALKFLG